MTHPAPLRWRKSTWSSQSDCVEVPETFDRVRDSKNHSVELLIGTAGWTAFLLATKSDAYNN